LDFAALWAVLAMGLGAMASAAGDSGSISVKPFIIHY
jgi:F0F1-type ATP synthase membrane subunit c/vacuolar-type H+-ATPase subunit K